VREAGCSPAATTGLDLHNATRKLFVPENEGLAQVVAVFWSIQIPERLRDALLGTREDNPSRSGELRRMSTTKKRAS
jgi:hypothetical protein